MAVILKIIPAELTGPQWEVIELGGGDTIEVAFRKPNLEEQLAAVGSEVGSYVGLQLITAIVDWRGVNDEKGQPVPYSWGALNQLCVGYPTAVFELIAARHKAFAGLSETESKNSPLPPGDGGTATPTETTNTTELSASGADSSGSSDYARSSD